MRVLGLGGERKELKKILAEMRIPEARRPAWPLLCSGDEIIWVFRGPMSESVRLEANSRRAVKIKLLARPGW